jgi:UDP-N-acetylmuramoyl-L-alanyl-D-glutamate--2,6-diaminopimelate ligase
VVLILGKGHEIGQEIDGRVFPFDDRDVARELLGIAPSSPESGPDSGSMSL